MNQHAWRIHINNKLHYVVPNVKYCPEKFGINTKWDSTAYDSHHCVWINYSYVRSSSEEQQQRLLLTNVCFLSSVATDAYIFSFDRLNLHWVQHVSFFRLCVCTCEHEDECHLLASFVISIAIQSQFVSTFAPCFVSRGFECQLKWQSGGRPGMSQCIVALKCFRPPFVYSLHWLWDHLAP